MAKGSAADTKPCNVSTTRNLFCKPQGCVAQRGFFFQKKFYCNVKKHTTFFGKRNVIFLKYRFFCNNKQTGSVEKKKVKGHTTSSRALLVNALSSFFLYYYGRGEGWQRTRVPSLSPKKPPRSYPPKKGQPRYWVTQGQCEGQRTKKTTPHFEGREKPPPTLRGDERHPSL